MLGLAKWETVLGTLQPRPPRQPEVPSQPSCRLAPVGPAFPPEKAPSLLAASALQGPQSSASRQLELEAFAVTHTAQSGDFLFVLKSYQLDGDTRQNPDLMGLQKANFCPQHIFPVQTPVRR